MRMSVCKKCGTYYETDRCPTCVKASEPAAPKSAEEEKADLRRQKLRLVAVLAALFIISGLLSMWIIHVLT